MFRAEPQRLYVGEKNQVMTVKWRIPNFPFFLCSGGDKFDVEPFTIENLGSTRWKLEIYPKGFSRENPSKNVFVNIRRLPDALRSGCSKCLHYDEVGIDLAVKLIENPSQHRISTVRTMRFKVFDIHGMDTGVLLEDLKPLSTNDEFLDFTVYLTDKRIENGVRDYLSLSNNMRQLYFTEENSDVTLCCKGIAHKVHRAVLNCRAKEFAKILGLSEWHKDSVTKVSITNISNVVLTVILTFIYSGMVDETTKEEELLEAVKLYGLEDLAFQLRNHGNFVVMRPVFNLEKTSFTFDLEANPSGEQILIRTLRYKTLPFEEMHVYCKLQKEVECDKGMRKAEVIFNIELHSCKVCFPVFLYVTIESEADKEHKEKRCTVLTCKSNSNRTVEWEFPVNISLSGDNSKLKMYFQIWDGKRVPIPERDTRNTPRNYYRENITYCNFLKLSQDLQYLFEQGLGSDFKIICNGEEFKVHKCILAARSLYFSRMFTSDMRESIEGRLFVVDLSVNDLKLFLSYLYKGTLPDLQHEFQTLIQLYAAADKYMVAELKRKCRDYFRHILNDDNGMDIYNLAIKHNDKRLIELTLKYQNPE